MYIAMYSLGVSIQNFIKAYGDKPLSDEQSDVSETETIRKTQRKRRKALIILKEQWWNFGKVNASLSTNWSDTLLAMEDIIKR